MSEADRRAEIDVLVQQSWPRAHTGFWNAWPEGKTWVPQKYANAKDPIGRLKEYYMFGQCSVFAAVLYEKTGWPVCGIYKRPYVTKNDAPDHWVCQVSEGVYADAIGMHRTLDELNLEFARFDRHKIQIHQRTLGNMFIRFARPAENFAVAREKHIAILLPDLQNVLAANPASEPVSKSRRVKQSVPAA